MENTKFKIPNLRYIGLFSKSIIFKTDRKTLYFLCTTKIKPIKVNANFLYSLETSENRICIQGTQKGILAKNW